MKSSLKAASRWLCMGATASIALNGMAQSILVSDPAVPLAPGIIRETAPTDSPFVPNYQKAVSGTPIEFGQFRLHPFVQTSLMQADGLPSGQGGNVDTTISTISAGLTADIGKHWILNYSPSWVNYSAASMQDSVNHDFKLIGATTLDAWALQFSEGFQSTNDILAETAQQTKQHTWATFLSATRSIGTRSSYQGTASLNERYADKAPDALTWSTQHWLKMQVSPRLNAGLGVDLSYIDFPHANRTNIKSTQYLGQLSWKPTNKLNLSAQGGVESRRAQAPGAATMHNPTLNISLGYQPFDHTQITLSNFRGVSNSYFDDTVTENKGWSVSLNQRLLEKLMLSVTYSDQSSDYTTFGGSTSPDPTVLGRSDDLTSFNSSLSIQLFRIWTLAAVYQRSKNISERAGLALTNFNFSTTQYGLQLGARF